MSEPPRAPDEPRPRRRWPWLLLGALLLISAPCCYVGGGVGFIFVKTQSRIAELKTQTDHAAVLAACRELMKTVAAENANAVVIAERAKMPPALAALKPNALYVTARDVRVVFGGGFQHFGFFALAADARESPPEKPYFHPEKLIDGLYFYTD